MKTNEPKKLTRSDVAKNMANWRARDEEMVTGVFRNLENPGRPLSFNLKLYDGDLRDWHFLDGEKYTIPRGVAAHIVNDCYYKEYKYLDGQTGQFGIRTAADGRQPIGQRNNGMIATRKIKRFDFSSLDFSNDDLDLKTADLVEVTSAPAVLRG